MAARQYDFSMLRGRIIEKYGTCAAFAEVVPISRVGLSARLGNKTQFKPDEIYLICEPSILDIPNEQIGKYFFTPKV